MKVSIIFHFRNTFFPSKKKKHVRIHPCSDSILLKPITSLDFCLDSFVPICTFDSITTRNFPRGQKSSGKYGGVLRAGQVTTHIERWLFTVVVSHTQCWSLASKFATAKLHAKIYGSVSRTSFHRRLPIWRSRTERSFSSSSISPFPSRWRTLCVPPLRRFDTRRTSHDDRSPRDDPAWRQRHVELVSFFKSCSSREWIHPLN